MSEWSNSIDKLYSTFLMRDLVSFLVPGTIVLSATILPSMTSSEALKFLDSIPLIAYIFIFGLAYAVGFAVQCLGDFAGIIRFYPKKIKNHDEFHVLRDKFSAATKDRPDIRQGNERYIVLKQMCGNVALSLFIALILFLSQSFNGISIHVILIWILLIGSLYVGHWQHINRQYKWMKQAIDKAEKHE